MWNTLPNQFPSPPAGKTGWPWTLTPGTSQADRGADVPWPKISIVTPSFNQGQFLEETIRSVLFQGYPNLEYWVMDGGSTDDSVAVLRKYEPWLAGWVSEKDQGQSHAINKGWGRATGEVLAWLNSDDWYQPDALWTVGRQFIEKPQCAWLMGVVENSHSPQKPARRFVPRVTSLAKCLGRRDYGFHQPGMFWRRRMVESLGPLDQSLHYCFDHDFWIRSLLAGYELLCLEESLAGFRWHRESKTVSRSHLFLEEDWIVFRRYRSRLSREDATQARQWLLEYEAEDLLNTTYRFLAAGGRWQALGHLSARLHLAPYLKPRRLILGALYRTLITGKPPFWFHRGE